MIFGTITDPPLYHLILQLDLGWYGTYTVYLNEEYHFITGEHEKNERFI